MIRHCGTVDRLRRSIICAYRSGAGCGLAGFGNQSEGIAKDAALNILETWVATDPAAAANWASQFPEGEIKTAAVKIVSSHWHQTDPGAAAVWIQICPAKRQPRKLNSVRPESMLNFNTRSYCSFHRRLKCGFFRQFVA